MTLSSTILGSVVLTGGLTSAGGAFLGRKIVADADGVPVELLFGTSVAATTTTERGHYAFTVQRDGAYEVRVHGRPGLETHSTVITVGPFPSFVDTLRLDSSGDLFPFPNPSADSVTTTFLLAGTEQASLRIYDRAGNLVRVLLDGQFPGGPNRMLWDGHDLHGAVVAPGFYWMTLDELGALTRAQLIFRE